MKCKCMENSGKILPNNRLGRSLKRGQRQRTILLSLYCFKMLKECFEHLFALCHLY